MKIWRWFKRLFKNPSPPLAKPPVGEFTPEKYKTMYLDLWKTMRVNHGKESTVQWYVNKVNEGKARYMSVSEESGVPWQVIGAIHLLEGSGSFSGVLHNGERILGTGKKTRLVPKGRGPFDTWEEAAIDALKIKSQPKKWTIENTLYYLEKYNGTGYLRDPKKPNSPYLWSFSNHYVKGKYISDGRYSSTAVSKQCGAALILKGLSYS